MGIFNWFKKRDKPSEKIFPDIACPKCKVLNKDSAIRCRYCNYEFPLIPQEEYGQADEKYNQKTNCIEIHAEASLNEFEAAGIEEVYLEAEWLTADDDLVCDFCRDKSKTKTGEKIYYTIDEARGKIPAHKNCRCVWIPYSKEWEEPLKGKEKEKGKETSPLKTSPIEGSKQIYGLASVSHDKQRGTKQYMPSQIDLTNIPYEPLPPSPSVWQAKTSNKKLLPVADLFSVVDGSNWSISETKILENEEKPEPFYNKVRFTSGGSLFIDSKGKNNKFPDCKASLLKRDRAGKVVAEKSLQYDIYRIGTSPINDWYVFMSSEGILHGYDGSLNTVFVHNLSTDPRIKSHYECTPPTWGTLRTHIRTVDINNGGDLFLFTIVDTAWCIDNQLNSRWGISMPLKDGWERIIRKTSTYGQREEVLKALDELGIALPVTQAEIKKAYRENVFKWHPDRSQDKNSTLKMQAITHAFSVLTGIDPDSIDVKEKIVFDYWKRPDYVTSADGITLSITISTGIPNDWIYASGFSADQKHIYLGSYAGKIVKIDLSGNPLKVYDISNVPRWIIDTGDYLYLQTDTRLYILLNGDLLVDLIDIWDKEKLIVSDNTFGFLGEKHLRWFDETGKPIGIVTTKNPIRTVYTSEKGVVVETRQHRAILKCN